MPPLRTQNICRKLPNKPCQHLSNNQGSKKEIKTIQNILKNNKYHNYTINTRNRTPQKQKWNTDTQQCNKWAAFTYNGEKQGKEQNFQKYRNKTRF
jgi:hypothetical protein